MPSPSSLLSRWADSLPAPDLAPRARVAHETRGLVVRARDAAAIPAELPGLPDLPLWNGPRSPKTPVRLGGSGLMFTLQDRWAIAGATGCGKSTLSLKLFAGLGRCYPFARGYILDSKPDEMFDRFAGRTLHEGQGLPPDPPPGSFVVWRPERNDIDLYDAWFEHLLKGQANDQREIGPLILLIDELSSIGGRSGISFPLNFERLLKQGRSKGKSLITLTQEATFIPRQVVGQATHLIRMALVNEVDAAKLDRLIHGSAKPRREPATRYGLWYRRMDTPGDATFFSDWRRMLA